MDAICMRYGWKVKVIHTYMGVTRLNAAWGKEQVWHLHVQT